MPFQKFLHLYSYKKNFENIFKNDLFKIRNITKLTSSRSILSQILYLSRKKNLSAKKIRGVLKKSYSKNSLPSIRYIKKLMGSSGKKVQKKNHRALASSIVDYIYARTLKLNGLESSKKL
ncbi:hypothetical protein BpHYR1_043142, partial [Brachionus plicatilis]